MNRRAAYGLLLSLLVMAAAGLVIAGKPPIMPAFYNGEMVFFTVVSQNVQGVEERGNLHDVAIPLYSFGPHGSELQPDVLSAIPGVTGYRPWWEVVQVVVLNGRDVTTNPFTSEQAILQAESAGEVDLIDTEFVFLCQVLPGNNR
ncbi:MAG: hypothetical protein HYZ57_06505 [Acidobacteria bacterium]|nr:hypothetical protein [Acidobacteriota bacterium]MBI3279475.1 hypothetical protein [Acidobacteriota bacterium]